LKVTALAAEYPITLVGYVYTSYGQRPLQQVKSEIDRWIDFYPGLQGIFLDEQASDREKTGYYRQLYQYVRTTLDLSLVVSNPGTICAEVYFTEPVADIICLYEGPKTVDAVSFPIWIDRYPDVEVALLPYEVDTIQSILGWLDLATKKRFTRFYATDDRRNNPWDRLPSYWEQLVDATQRVNIEITAASPGAKVQFPLLLQLQQGNPEQRSQAAVALAERDQSEIRIITALIRALRDKEPQVRTSVAYALGQLGSPEKETVQALTNALGDTDWRVRRDAADALANIGLPPVSDEIPEVIAPLLKALVDQDSQVRANVANILNGVERSDQQVVSALIEALKDKSMRVRANAIDALGKNKRPLDQILLVLT